jgi:hypothetical protein
MNKVITVIVFLIFTKISLCQVEEKKENFNIELNRIQKTIERKIEKLKLQIDQIIDSSNANGTEINQLKTRLNNLSSSIDSVNDNLGNKISVTETTSKNQINELDGDLEKNRLYWIIATLVTLLLGALMYLFLGKRIKSSKMDVETQIRNTKKSLEEESLKLDGELVKVFQKQLEVLEAAPKEVSQDDDHSLVLKIADRLTAMETNIYRMDPNTRGLNNLKNLVKSTKENFNAKEYEIVEMLGKEYKEGMEVIATFIPSDEIEIGKQIITRVIKPQVNFKGQKIQAAQIEVSIGE